MITFRLGNRFKVGSFIIPSIFFVGKCFLDKKVDKKARLNYDRKEKTMKNNFLKKNFSKLKRAIILTSATAILLPVGALAFVFEKSLAEGDEGISVKNLQIILNQDEETKIAEAGAGSPGRETSFFGAKTASALVRFQRENDLFSEKGIVGPKTRLVLNKKIAEDYLASKTVKSKKNKLNLIETEQKFNLKLPTGVKSRRTSFPLKSVISTSTTSSTVKKSSTTNVRPKITSISPTFGGYGTIVTIRGENFATSSTNTIYTGYSILKNVSSYDGKTMTFVVEAFSDIYQQSRSLASHFTSFSTPFFVYVENGGGRSNGLYFNYSF